VAIATWRDRGRELLRALDRKKNRFWMERSPTLTRSCGHGETFIYFSPELKRRRWPLVTASGFKTVPVTGTTIADCGARRSGRALRSFLSLAHRPATKVRELDDSHASAPIRWVSQWDNLDARSNAVIGRSIFFDGVSFGAIFARQRLSAVGVLSITDAHQTSTPTGVLSAISLATCVIAMPRFAVGGSCGVWWT